MQQQDPKSASKTKFEFTEGIFGGEEDEIEKPMDFKFTKGINLSGKRALQGYASETNEQGVR